MASIREKVLENLDSELGTDLKNLSKCEGLAKKYLDEKESIEEKILDASKDVSSPELVSEIDDVSHTIDEISKEFNMLCKITKEIDRSKDNTLDGLQQQIRKIQELEQGLFYLRCIRSIQGISCRFISDESVKASKTSAEVSARCHVAQVAGQSILYELTAKALNGKAKHKTVMKAKALSEHYQYANIEMFLASRSETEAVAEFGVLCQMCSRLQNSKCSHLTTFLSDTVHHWHNVLKDRFSVQLEEVLKCAGWPVVSSTLLTTPQTDAFAKCQTIVKHLLNIQLPPQLSPLPAVTSSLLASFPPLSLPLLLLLKPLRKRFVYHFCGSRQTNRPDKPEWFLTQVLTWIRDHEHFITQWVQPVFNQTNRSQKSASLEFTQGLVELVVDKLHSDMPTLMYDDALFSHTVDETLGFDRELRDIYGYPESLPSAVTVLTQAQVLVKWIHMERKYARDKMDSILSSESAWTELGGSDDLKITEAAEAFLTLLSTMTERYSVLPQPGHRLQFVELQLELTDELRVRLLQLLHSERQDPLESRLPAILNTASYISEALAEWGTSPHFLMLQHFKSELEAVTGELSAMQAASLKQGTVFDQTLNLLQHLVQELVDVLCEAVMMEVKARSRSYRRDKWFAMTCDVSLTPSACPMFQVLVSKLHTLQSLLASSLFTTAWQSIATQLCTFLLEELVLQNRFNEGGAKQLEQDLTRSLIPLFHQYTQRPEAYFLSLKEACALLNVRPLPGDWSRGKYDKLPMEIHHLSPEMVHNIIQRRADIIPDLM